MNAVPRRWGGDGLRVGPLGDGGLWVECEVSHPASRKGQTVNLFLDREDVVDLLLKLRDSAIRARRRTMAEGPGDVT